MKKQVLWGVLLLLAGAYFLLAALFDLPGGIFFVFLGLAFLLARLISGKSGFTIPGSILFWLGAGQTLQHYFALTSSDLAVLFLSLSLGFLFIHILDFRKLGNWPLIPALVLFVGGAAMIVVRDEYLFNLIKPYFAYILPCLLILVGACILLGGLLRGGRQKAAPQAEEPYRQASYNYYPPQQPPQPQPQQPPQQPPRDDAAYVFDGQGEAQERPKEEPPAPAAEQAQTPPEKEAEPPFEQQ